MRLRFPGPARALVVVTAAGLLLSGCHYYRPVHGGPHYAAPNYGKHYDHRKGGHGRHGHHRRGGRGYY